MVVRGVCLSDLLLLVPYVVLSPKKRDIIIGINYACCLTSDNVHAACVNRQKKMTKKQKIFVRGRPGGNPTKRKSKNNVEELGGHGTQRKHDR